MKKYTILLLILTSAIKTTAQTSVTKTETKFEQSEVIEKNGLKLRYVTNVADFSPVVKKKLIDAFFEVYPKEIKRFNTKSAKEVIFDIDSTYNGVAATSDAHVRYNPEWFKKHPEDIDVVTHEVMHIVQSYGNNDVPGWLTEGIADYARYVYGVNNQAAGWKLPDYKAGQSYTNAYRITARFLVWTEKHTQKPELVNQLDKAMRAGTYSAELWKQITGKTVDELWKEYSETPAL